MSLISIPDLESAKNKIQDKLVQDGLEVPASTFIFQVQRLTSKIKSGSFTEKSLQDAVERWTQCFSTGKVSDIEVTRRLENVVVLLAGGISDSKENIEKVNTILSQYSSSLGKVLGEGNAIQRAHKGAAVKYMKAVSMILESVKAS